MKRVPALTVAAAALIAVAAPVAQAAAVKRLAWNKVAAALTTQAKAKRYAVTCSGWSTDLATLECIFYNPAPAPSATTFIKDGRHVAYGKISMSRYDQKSLADEPHAGCTYGFSVYGPTLAHGRTIVVNICDKGWLAKVPAP